ncbi:MAG: hypothetical protein PHW76_09695, partial [Alphaproteobacteria bacterium]|nr:hypothetical protein [Alphaproteobacteria bacterium]
MSAAFWFLGTNHFQKKIGNPALLTRYTFGPTRMFRLWWTVAFLFGSFVLLFVIVGAVFELRSFAFPIMVSLMIQG